MLNSEFENKVRQKMEELQLAPGEQVWDQIERNLPGQEKRRPWLLYLGLSVLLLAGFFFIWNKTADDKQPVVAGKTPDKEHVDGRKANAAGAPAIETGGDDRSKPTDAVTSEENLERSVVAPKPPASAPAVINTADNRVVDITASHTRTSPVFKQASRTKATLTAATATSDDPSPINQTLPGMGEPAANKRADSEPLKPLPWSGAILPKQLSEQRSVPDSMVNSDRPTEISGKPLANVLFDSTQLAALPMVKRTAPTKWQYGVTIAAGFSNVVNGLFNNDQVLADNFGNSSGGVSGPGTGSGVVSPPNDPMPAAAFAAGVQMERSIGKRWKVLVGLQYGYLSSVVKTGSLVDSSATFNIGNGSIAADNFYLPGSGERYKNKTHLLQVPLLFQYSVSSRVPVYLEAGPALSYLLGSNILLYNSTGRAYFSNPNAYNKLLLSFTAGAGIEFNQEKQPPFRLGYRFNYSSSSVTKEAFGKQHLQHSMLYISIPIKK